MKFKSDRGTIVPPGTTHEINTWMGWRPIRVEGDKMYPTTDWHIVVTLASGKHFSTSFLDYKGKDNCREYSPTRKIKLTHSA